jgi:molecular chaperone GrpE
MEGAARSPREAFAALGRDVADLLRQVGRQRTQIADARTAAQEQQRRMLLDLVEVMDGFDRVFANVEPREAQVERQARIWIGNFRSVRKVLEGVLRKNGVVRIEAPEGKAVPGLHTVVEGRQQLDLEDGSILEELQKGYLWNGEVLRKAQVVTVRN